MNPSKLLKTQQKPYVGSEDQFQQSVARYLDTLGVLWTHVSNEQKTGMKQKKDGTWYSATGNKNKAKGKKAGVPDVLIFEPRFNFVGLAIELKVGRNKPSEKQLEWLKSLENRKWKTLITHSLDEVIAVVQQYLEPLKSPNV